MASSRNLPTASWRRYAPVYLALGVGAVVSLALFLISRSVLTSSAATAFERRAGTVTAVLEIGIGTYLQVVQSLRNFFVASDTVLPEEFHTFLRWEVTNAPGLRALGWAPAVPPDRIDEVEAELTAEHNVPVRVHVLTPDGPAPAPPSDVHLPAFYIAPRQGNEAYLGLDLATDPYRSSAVHRAIALGSIAASDWMGVVGGGTGVMLVAPVRDGSGSPLRGVVFGSFGIADLIHSTLGGVQTDVNIEILNTAEDGPGQKGLRYDGEEGSLTPIDEAEASRHPSSRFVRRYTLSVAGQEWALVFYPTEDLDIKYWISWAFLATGLALTGLLAAYLTMSIRRTGEIVGVNRSLEREASLRRRVEAELRESETDQRLLAEASRVLVSSLDYEATLRAVARLVVPTLADWAIIHLVRPGDVIALLEVAGIDAEREKRIRELLERHPLDMGRSSLPIVQVIRTGESHLVSDLTEEDLRAISLDEEPLEIYRSGRGGSLLIVPLRARDRTLGTITLLTTDGRRLDAGDRALAEELAVRAAFAVENAQLFEAAQAASQAKSNFLAVISHELRTPLNAIMGYTDLLLMGVPEPPGEEQRKQIMRISASARHLLELIEEILTFSRLEGGEESVRAGFGDLRRVVEETVARMRPSAEEKGLALRVDLPDEPLEASTDAAMVRQILTNLLSNAIKFTERGEVTVRGERQEDRIVIHVRDTGIGIPPEQMDHLFDPFWQAEEATTRRVGGTGLGLPVARRLTHLLGGTLSVESEVGRGSTFTVSIPRTVGEASTQSDEREREAQ